MTKDRFATTVLTGFAAVLILSLQPFVSQANDLAADKVVENIASGAGVVISEVYPNAALEDERPDDQPGINPVEAAQSGFEFIELYNRGNTAIPLNKLKIVRDDDVSGDRAIDGQILLRETGLAGIELAPGQRIAFMPPFSVVNGGTHLRLYYLDSLQGLQAQKQGDNAQPLELLLQTVSYTGSTAPEGTSLQLYGGQWFAELDPTPGSVPVFFADQGNDTETDSQPTDPTLASTGDGQSSSGQSNSHGKTAVACQATQVWISEIVSDPDGYDSQGGEFVELRNKSSASMPLAGCTLTTDKDYEHTFPAGTTIPAGGYKAIKLSNNLLNSGGTVTFSGKTYVNTVTYPELDEDQAYAKIKGQWQRTNKPTPGEPNRLPTIAERMAALRERLGACPPGQTRSLETHRCNAPDDGPDYVPCGPNEYRNPETHRCNDKDDGKDYVPCEPNEYRSPKTHRCRDKENVSGGVLGAKSGSGGTGGAGSSSTSQNLTVLLIAGGFLVLFLLYEYRLTIRDWLHRIRSRKAAV